MVIVGILLLEVTLQQALQSLAVAGLTDASDTANWYREGCLPGTFRGNKAPERVLRYCYLAGLFELSYCRQEIFQSPVRRNSI